MTVMAIWSKIMATNHDNNGHRLDSDSQIFVAIVVAVIVMVCGHHGLWQSFVGALSQSVVTDLLSPVKTTLLLDMGKDNCVVISYCITIRSLCNFSTYYNYSKSQPSCQDFWTDLSQNKYISEFLYSVLLAILQLA